MLLSVARTVNRFCVGNPLSFAVCRHLSFLALAAPLLWATAPAVAAPGDNYPEKPITVIVPFAAGAATDVNSRRLFQHVSASTGWQFVIENRPGANSIIGIDTALRAPRDDNSLEGRGHRY